MSEPRLSGKATAEGTARGAESFGAGVRTLGRTGYSVSPVGFGGYRVRDGSPIHRRALADALRGGVNLIDTSTNYGDGASESLVGTVLTNLVQQGELRREHVVVVSKVGYLQGQNLKRAEARSEPFEQIVEMRPGLSHCIHPEFVRAQLDESLERLGLAHLDVLLLHNPEYFLEEAAGRDVERSDARAQFRERLLAAFTHLEKEVAAGRISWYGVSSNGFALEDDATTSTSVAEMLELARQAGGDDHHLAVVQLPMNLLELGAMSRRLSTPDGERSPLQVAEAEDLGVLVNRPLNAWGQVDGRERLVRLADQTRDEDAPGTGVEPALAAVRKLEAQWATGLGKQLMTEEDGEDAVDLFRWGQELSRGLSQLGSLEQWTRLRHDVIAPHLGQTSSGLLGALEGEIKREFATWWEAYGTAMYGLFGAIEQHLSARHRATAEQVAERLDPHLPKPWRSLPLSRKVVLSLLSAPISCVLVGMRQPGYVFDMLALREHPVRLLSAAAGAADLTAIAASFESMTAG